MRSTTGVTSQSVPENKRYLRQGKIKSITTKSKRSIRRLNSRKVGKKGKLQHWSIGKKIQTVGCCEEKGPDQGNCCELLLTKLSELIELEQRKEQREKDIFDFFCLLHGLDTNLNFSLEEIDEYIKTEQTKIY